MAESLKEQLQKRPDLREQEITLDPFDLKVTIRRMTVGERKKIYAQFGGKTSEHAQDISGEILKISVIPALTDEDIEAMPTAVVEKLSDAIMDFNGWSKKGAAEHADQFRPTA